MTGYAGHAEGAEAPEITGDLTAAHLEAAEALLNLITTSKDVRSWREGDDSATYHDPAQLANALANLLEQSGNVEAASAAPAETFVQI